MSPSLAPIPGKLIPDMPVVPEKLPTKAVPELEPLVFLPDSVSAAWLCFSGWRGGRAPMEF